MSLGLNNCEGCENKCRYKPVERRVVVERGYCIRASQDGKAGEMTHVGFKPWTQVFKEMKISTQGSTIVHFIRQ